MTDEKETPPAAMPVPEPQPPPDPYPVPKGWDENEWKKQKEGFKRHYLFAMEQTRKIKEGRK